MTECTAYRLSEFLCRITCAYSSDAFELPVQYILFYLVNTIKNGPIYTHMPTTFRLIFSFHTTCLLLHSLSYNFETIDMMLLATWMVENGSYWYGV